MQWDTNSPFLFSILALDHFFGVRACRSPNSVYCATPPIHRHSAIFAENTHKKSTVLVAGDINITFNSYSASLKIDRQRHHYSPSVSAN